MRGCAQAVEEGGAKLIINTVLLDAVFNMVLYADKFTDELSLGTVPENMSDGLRVVGNNKIFSNKNPKIICPRKIQEWVCKYSPLLSL